MFVCCGCCDCWVVGRLVVWLSLFGCLLLVGLLRTGTCVYCLGGFVCCFRTWFSVVWGLIVVGASLISVAMVLDLRLLPLGRVCLLIVLAISLFYSIWCCVCVSLT